MRLRYTGFLAVLALFLVIACDMGTEPKDTDDTNNTIDSVSFKQDVQPIFDDKCIACHGGNGGLFLTSGQSYSNLVGVESNGYAPLKRVVPSKPDSSVLYLKISDNPPIDVGERMPQGGPYLSDENITTIGEWIEEGALNN